MDSSWSSEAQKITVENVGLESLFQCGSGLYGAMQ